MKTDSRDKLTPHFPESQLPQTGSMNWQDLEALGKQLPESEWLRYRGVGPVTLKRLAAKGLVENSAEFEGLGARSVNALRNAGIHTRSQAKDLVQSGKLTPMTLRNFGAKSYSELCDFLGIRTHPADPRPRCKECGRVLMRHLHDISKELTPP